ncbi:OX-2 membrane glycoprotein-like isoform X4 [Oreochromis niloticus]|uniref:OX-2 membrane glycoprotein-like isoform X4 n=1 Tax=Oreochromis niloticus TaxID=8128 RepID=UPI000DF13E3A|nr:OX-2 membrane glycoprotein-like isoform X4 [Oreochromis niloticus]
MMPRFGVTCYYVTTVLIFGVFDKALTAVIQTQQTVLAAVGEDAEFSCQLLETKDVLQVTWQKISPEVETNVATYSKQFGQRVNDGFTDKVEFKHTGLQNCSIVIRNVTEQDEGCYPCLFNTYPEGSFTGQTCLKVYELHEPVVDVRESNTTEEWVVSCSATGRPAPTVTLSVSQQDLNFSQYNTVSVSNTNTTFTVTTTAVLSGSCKHSTQVGCAARVLSAPHREVMVMIPDDDDDGLNEKSGSNQRNLGELMFVLFTDSVYCYFVGVQIIFFSFPICVKALRISVMLASVLLVACGFFIFTHLSPAQKENSEQSVTQGDD